MNGAMDDAPALEELFASLPVTADWTMGFLTAVCTGPDGVSSRVWLPEILEAPNPAQAELLERLNGAVVETLSSRPEMIPPEIDKPEEDAMEFCRGYLRGARLHPSWAADDVATTKLAPFEALAKETDETHRAELGRHVAELRAYWQAKRQIVNTGPKVGRNDPCPCGSGKKHKKCCL